MQHFEIILLKKKNCILIEIPVLFVLEGPVDNNIALV